ncbi:MAG TPA: HNH endonuclease, partial [Bacillales bacterium]|nr:HNH endonuclease [Bacillales bacterium]
MSLNSRLLFYFVRDALAPYSEDFKIVNRANPVQLNLNKKRYSAHISYVHDSGKNRNNPEERRIQISRPSIETQRERKKSGERIAFIGFFEMGDVFVAWDPRHVLSLHAKTRDSVYARQWQQERVLERQAAVYEFKSSAIGQSFAIALPATALGFYLENIEQFHHLPNEDAIIQVVSDHSEVLSDEGRGKAGAIVKIEKSGKREKFSYTRKAFPRDPRFKQRVLSAYDQTCCICGRQLALVQAAHIIPHNIEDSPNDVTNGLALCIEHHKLYDDVLLLPGPEYRLLFNNDRAKFLSETGQDKGLNEVRK